MEHQHNDKATLADALTASVNEAWEHLPVQTIIDVFGKTPEALQMIINENSRNDCVEKRSHHHHHAAAEEARE
jgi:hypothetical protein